VPKTVNVNISPPIVSNGYTAILVRSRGIIKVYLVIRVSFDEKTEKEGTKYNGKESK